MTASAARRRAFGRGLRAERLAALWLQLKGYRILARRFRCHQGEVDIIARRGPVLAIVEVKARPGVAAAIDAIPHHAWRRIEAAADVWSSRQDGMAGLSIRYDVVAVLGPFRLRHLPGAWQAPAQR